MPPRRPLDRDTTLSHPSQPNLDVAQARFEVKYVHRTVNVTIETLVRHEQRINHAQRQEFQAAYFELHHAGRIAHLEPPNRIDEFAKTIPDTERGKLDRQYLEAMAIYLKITESDYGTRCGVLSKAGQA